MRDSTHLHNNLHLPAVDAAHSGSSRYGDVRVFTLWDTEDPDGISQSGKHSPLTMQKSVPHKRQGGAQASQWASTAADHIPRLLLGISCRCAESEA